MKLTHSLGVKITVIFLFALLSFAVIAGVGLIVVFQNEAGDELLPLGKAAHVLLDGM